MAITTLGLGPPGFSALHPNIENSGLYIFFCFYTSLHFPKISASSTYYLPQQAEDKEFVGLNCKTWGRGYRNMGDSKAVKPLKTFSSGWMIFLCLNGLNPPFRQLFFLCTLAPPETTALCAIRQTRDCLGDAGWNSWNLRRGSVDVLASFYERIVNKTDWGSLSTSHRCSDEDDGCYSPRLTLSDALVLEDSESELPSALAGSWTVSFSVFTGVLVCKCLTLCRLYFLPYSQRLNVGNPISSTPPTLVDHRLLFLMSFWHLASTTVSWQHQ